MLGQRRGPSIGPTPRVFWVLSYVNNGFLAQHWQSAGKYRVVAEQSPDMCTLCYIDRQRSRYVSYSNCCVIPHTPHAGCT